MQPLVLPVRNTLSDTDIYGLIKLNPSITTGMGMELLDRDLNVLADITNDLKECSVTRDNTLSLHGSATFTTVARMQWGRAVVRPYFKLGNGTITARFNQGAYFTSTPATKTDQLLPAFDVQGYDILTALNTLVGDSYAINIGDSYLTAVENILLAQGYTQYHIDPTRAATVATVAKGWPLDETTTWLQIVNELLTAVGYRNIYSDWDGVLICESLIDTTSATPSWAYDRGEFTGQLVPGQTITHDFFDTPNRWVGVQGNRDTTTSPTEGNGVFTYVNQNDGETSINARDQTRTKVLTITAADQDALVAAVMAQVATDKNVGTTMEATSSANPLHWHGDIVTVETLELGVRRMQQIRWGMNLRTGEMSHSWAVLS